MTDDNLMSCGVESNHRHKSEAIHQAIRDCEVGSEIIIYNDDGSVWCILKVEMKEMEHSKDDVHIGGTEVK